MQLTNKRDSIHRTDHIESVEVQSPVVQGNMSNILQWPWWPMKWSKQRNSVSKMKEKTDLFRFGVKLQLKIETK